MVNRQVIRCEVCSALTLVRIQVGWQEEFPLRFACGGCGILITGMAKLDFEQVTGPQVRYENGELLTAPLEAAFHLETSSEFLTVKPGPANGGMMEGVLTPFMRAFTTMGEDGYLSFSQRTKQFLHHAKNEWPRVRRINELWLNRKLELLAKDIRDFLPAEGFPMRDEFECLRGVRALTVHFLSPTLDEAQLEHCAKLRGEVLSKATPDQRKSLKEFANHLAERKLLGRLEERVLAFTATFVDRFKYLVPAFGLRFFEHRPGDLFKQSCITTASFDDLKQFFVDGFELAADLLLIIIGRNNAFHRSDWNAMVAKRHDVKTLADFESKTKGERIQFLEQGEVFDWILKPVLDSKIRNAIAHNAYHYDNTTQAITYYPHGNEVESNRHTLYMAEFAEKCLRLFGAVQVAAELLFETHRIFFFNQRQGA